MVLLSSFSSRDKDYLKMAVWEDILNDCIRFLQKQIQFKQSYEWDAKSLVIIRFKVVFGKFSGTSIKGF